MICKYCGGDANSGRAATNLAGDEHYSKIDCAEVLKDENKRLIDDGTKAYNASYQEGLVHGRKKQERLSEKYRRALEQVVVALGPKPPDCGCSGCSVEMDLALKAAQEALLDKEEGEGDGKA